MIEAMTFIFSLAVYILLDEPRGTRYKYGDEYGKDDDDE